MIAKVDSIVVGSANIDSANPFAVRVYQPCTWVASDCLFMHPRTNDTMAIAANINIGIAASGPIEPEKMPLSQVRLGNALRYVF